MDEREYYLELNKCIRRILDSRAPRKLIVSGPGTGKSWFFKRAIEHYGGIPEDYLVLTFINNLEDELKKDLGDIAKVFTFHAYCHLLLRKSSDLRSGLRDKFYYYPALVELVKSDWSVANGQDVPKFVRLMRNVLEGEELEFFISRGNYYNATGYDDSVFRVYKALKSSEDFKERYKLIIVDEYQDFNALETAVLSQIIKFNPCLIVGDDDQALYCQLRDSNPEFIRELFQAQDFENFELPFCLRCPNAVISIFDSIINTSRSKGILAKRIDKKFNFFPPIKGGDSEKYPRARIVISSIQKKSPTTANYFGRYILGEIAKIPQDEIEESHEKDFPTILIIGPNYYLKTLVPILDEHGYEYEFRQTEQKVRIDIQDGLRFLSDNEVSNLGWRIILEATKPDFYKENVFISTIEAADLVDIIPNRFKEKFLKEANSNNEKEEEETIVDRPEFNKSKPTIKLTTFEGAKGLSAQHVFIQGLQNGDLPKDPKSISDIEVCKLLVALTRTRKQCHLLSTKKFAGKPTPPSEFLNWIEEKDIDFIKIDKNYWEMGK